MAAAPAPNGEDPPALRLPPITVEADAGSVAKFRRETGAPAIEGMVPLTFPICWLALPAIRPAIRQMIGEGFLPVHESQSFAFDRRLEIGAEYVIELELRRASDPPRLFLQAAIATPQGETRGRLDAVLRLVPLALGCAP